MEQDQKSSQPLPVNDDSAEVIRQGRLAGYEQTGQEILTKLSERIAQLSR